MVGEPDEPDESAGADAQEPESSDVVTSDAPEDASETADATDHPIPADEDDELEADEEHELEADLPEPAPDEPEAPAIEASEGSEDGDEPEPDDGQATPAYEALPPWERPKRRFRWVARIVVLIAVLVPAFVVGKVILGATGVQKDDGPKVDARLAGALRYDSSGNALVLAPTANLGVGSIRRRTWRVCGEKCDKASGHGTRFTPGVVKGGSRVELTVTGTKGTRLIKTPDWNGQLTVRNPPVLKGDLRVGATVSAEGGDWIGGWTGGITRLGLRACPTAKSSGKCVAFTASILGEGHEAKRLIPDSFRGWWIGALEWKVPPLRETKKTQVATDPTKPAGAPRAPLPSVTVAAGELVGPVL